MELIALPDQAARLASHMELIALPDQAARLASRKASEHVGWAWQTRATSSQLAPYSIARAASLIISPAPGPMMWAPNSLSVFLSPRIFTMPSVSLLHLALLLAAKGNLPTEYSIPSALRSSSFLPTQATSGCV